MRNFNCASEDDEEKIRDFIDKLKDVNIWFYVFQRDNIWKGSDPYSHPLRLEPAFSSKFDLYEKMRKPIEGIDLGPLKHFSNDSLIKITGDFSENNFIRKSSGGRQFRGNIIDWQGSSQDVLVKRWDLFIRLGGFTTYHEYPYLFSYQLEFLLNPCVASHPNMAKLIGFSCDKTFVLVFELKVNRTLEDLIPRATFRWSQRMKIAREVADTLKFFHGNQIAVCNFSSYCISVDEDYNIKLFEFDCSLHLENPNRVVAEWLCPGRLNCNSSESWMQEHFEREWFYTIDVFDFGVLLIELIRARCVGEDSDYNFIECAKKDFAKGDTSSLYNVTLGIPQRRIFDLAMKCVQRDPKVQPNMDEIVMELDKVSEFGTMC